MSTKRINKNSSISIKNQTQIEGTMTFIETDNKQHLMDFVNDEDAMMTPATFVGKVQIMRDGNVYISEKKRHKRNKPIFREDHSSLSLGHDGKYYFYFAMAEEQAGELPDQLVSEALAIAQKMANALLNAMEEEA